MIATPQELAYDPGEAFELEPSGQFSIGVAGEQRAFPLMAPEGKPAPVGHKSDHTTPAGLWQPATDDELEELARQHVAELELEEA